MNFVKLLNRYNNFIGYFRVLSCSTNGLRYVAKNHVLINKIISKNITMATNQQNLIQNRKFSDYSELVDNITYEKVCDETLESLCSYFEELVDDSPHLQSADVSYGNGVLTINFGATHGTYVINRQSPNRQIWLSSPTSGPKRYDFLVDKNIWIYKHDNISLHQLLQEEIKKIVQKDVHFGNCAYGVSS